MWKYFSLLAVLAALRLWHIDHGLLAGLSLLSGGLVFWSAGVIDNLVLTRRFFSAKGLWALCLSVNLVGSLGAAAFAALGYVLKP
ncbi:hypothetical protein ACD591_01155 [Rufibacter glacialis]|uniref:Uncharacterized protein n=1 Tax=Rufibacter glacialis TaxID=1259555 RepID=A0A5M8QHE9_9BACT|nr:hypothetical protein [Rufibacter glacialis]KAA6435507.1 hypothetical protein FOE74_06055 [Rufibacter glacialis]GGK64133.1 hypothetical protein GCM10011405_10110 [Rufibacter glacialis]